MSEIRSIEQRVSDWPPTVIGGCEFRRCIDGFLEVDFDPESREGWKGRYFTEVEALEIRDFLNKAFP